MRNAMTLRATTIRQVNAFEELNEWVLKSKPQWAEVKDSPSRLRVGHQERWLRYTSAMSAELAISEFTFRRVATTTPVVGKSFFAIGELVLIIDIEHDVVALACQPSSTLKLITVHWFLNACMRCPRESRPFLNFTPQESASRISSSIFRWSSKSGFFHRRDDSTTPN